MAPIVVVGLGPGPAEWVTSAAVDALRRSDARVFVRTELHPAVPALLRDVAYESFDALYTSASSLSTLHAHVAARLLAAASEGRCVVVGVPGDGSLGDALLDLLARSGLRARVIPGVPLGVGALAEAQLPATDGAQIVDAVALVGAGRDPGVELNPRWAAAVTGLFNRQVASDVKLALQRVYPAEHEVRVVRHPGLADSHVARMPLVELDRGGVEMDHLTHVVLGPVATPVPTGSAHGLRAIVAQLRAPEGGCPWDLEQTHRTLAPYAIEEAYEVAEAMEEGDPAHLAEELGDLLMQVVLNAEVADQDNTFDWNDVVRGISDKLVRRHPHVFGDTRIGTAADVVRSWDALKAAERLSADTLPSAIDGVPRSLPALKAASELARKASKVGFDWPERAGTVDKVREELAELLAAESLAERREELGDLLYIIAKLARDDGVDPEDALRAANQKFARRFKVLEDIARERLWDGFEGHSRETLLAAWDEAKARTATLPTLSERD